MTLRERLESIVNGAEGRVQVAVIDTRSGRRTVVSDEVPIVTASVNKIAALVELYRQVDQGLVDMGTEVYVTMDDYPSGGSPMVDDGLIPGTFTLSQLAQEMISRSDNTATNVIMTTVGRANIRTMLTSIGVNRQMVMPTSYTKDEPGRRWVTDHWEYTMAGYEGAHKTTASNVARLLTAIYRGDILTPESRADVLGVMRLTQDKSRLRGGMPPETPISHKAGSNTGRLVELPATWEGWAEAPGISNDAGIVTLPGFEYIVVVLTEGDNASVDSVGSAIVRQISATVYDWIIGGKGTLPNVKAIYTDHGRLQLKPLLP